jgi:hypothetical protein
VADVEPCPTCGEPHLTAQHGVQACTGHISTGERAGQPCRRSPIRGARVCQYHGGAAKQVREAGQRNVAEQKAAATARKLIPDVAERVAITNPLETLLELAGEVNAFRESLRIKANELDGIRYAAGSGAGEQTRAEVTLYRQAIKDTTDLLVAIARLDIEKMLARIESRKVEMTLDAMNQGCTDAGLNEDQKRAVMVGVARHLRVVRRSA